MYSTIRYKIDSSVITDRHLIGKYSALWSLFYVQMLVSNWSLLYHKKDISWLVLAGIYTLSLSSRAMIQTLLHSSYMQQHKHVRIYIYSKNTLLTRTFIFILHSVMCHINKRKNDSVPTRFCIIHVYCYIISSKRQKQGVE